MTLRRNSPLLNGGTHNAIGVAVPPSRKPVRLIVFLLMAGALYYNVNVKEKALIESSQEMPSRPELQTFDIPAARFDTAHTKTQFILEPSNEFTPKIAWLMSFPNSGTSFTMTLVARASNKAFATNYGDEVTAKDEVDTLSIYPRRPEGPFWAGLSGKVATPRELPDTYVLTKTHCGSRCINCGPDQYVETPKQFLRKCASGHARVPPRRRRIDVEYDPSRVYKAIHLIRNPLHNIIARYHLEHRHYEYSNKTEWLDQHSNDAQGLLAWCNDLDTFYAKEDEKFFNDKIPKAPCHGEFYKFAQWHNLVHEGLALIPHEVPVLTVYYEEYATHFNSTTNLILDFLELEHVGESREFAARSDYDGYFSKKQEANIKALLKRVAHTETWEQIKQYFE
jgi:hypothetical protein